MTLRLSPQLRHKPKAGSKCCIQHYETKIRSRRMRTLFISFSPDEKWLAFGGENLLVDLQLASDPANVLMTFNGHTGSVQHLDWGTDSCHLRTTSVNGELKNWGLKKHDITGWGHLEKRGKELKDVEWSSCSCPLGWAVQGLTSDFQAQLRPNFVVCRIPGSDLLCYGDSVGKLHLCVYPSLSERQAKKVYSGHSAAVTSVAVLRNSEKLISTSHDVAVLRWRIQMDKIKPSLQLKASVLGEQGSKGPIAVRDGARSVVMHGDVACSDRLSCPHCLANANLPRVIADPAPDFASFYVIAELIFRQKHDDGITAVNELPKEYEPAILQHLMEVLGVEASDMNISKARLISRYMLRFSFMIRNLMQQDIRHSDIEFRLKKYADCELSLMDDIWMKMVEIGPDDQDPSEFKPLPEEHTYKSPRGHDQRHETSVMEEDFTVQHVFGYSGMARKNNLNIIRTGELLYYSGCVVVIANVETRIQRHFLGHQQDVVCSDLHPDLLTVCTASNGSYPVIHIWDSVSMAVQNTLTMGQKRGTAIARFSNDGQHLLVVATNTLQTLIMYQWNTGNQVVSADFQVPAVTSIGFDPFSPLTKQNIVLTSEMGVTFWTFWIDQKNKESRLRRRNPDWDDKSEQAHFLSCNFVDDEVVLTGAADGHVCFWRDMRRFRTVQAHSGPIFSIQLDWTNCTVATSSGDAVIKFWDCLLDQAAVVILRIHIATVLEQKCLGHVALRGTESLLHLRELLMDGTLCSEHKALLHHGEFLFAVNNKVQPLAAPEEVGVKASQLKGSVWIVHMERHGQVSASAANVAVTAISWRSGQFAFGTGSDEVYSMPRITDCREPVQVAFAVEKKILAMSMHPRKAIAFSVSQSGLLQVWDFNQRRCVAQKELHQKVRDMHASPDGLLLAVAAEDACLILDPNTLVLRHSVEYRQSRQTTISCVKFAPSGDYLAIGTNEGKIDIFDVYGRTVIAEWISKHFGKAVDPGGLETDFADGVLLCKLIQELTKQATDGKTVSRLRAYAIFVDSAPLITAWHSRPKTYQACIELLNEGLELAHEGTEFALKTVYELDANLDQEDFKNPKAALDPSRIERRQRVRKRIRMLQSSTLHRPEEVLTEYGPAHRIKLFELFNFLKALDFSNIEAEGHEFDRQVQLRVQASNLKTQIGGVGKNLKSKEEDLEVIKKKLEVARSRNQELSIRMLERDSIRMAGEIAGLRDYLKDLSSFEQQVQEASILCEYTIQRSGEDSFLFLGSCTGSRPHTGQVDQIDWSTDGLAIQTICSQAAELKYWHSFSMTQSDQPTQANKEWASHNCTLGWAVSSMINFGSYDIQPFRTIDRTSPSASGRMLMGIGHSSGRVLLSRFPASTRYEEVLLTMKPSFVDSVGLQRVTEELVEELIEEITELLQTNRARFQIMRTSPVVINLRILPPNTREDPRGSRQLYALLYDLMKHPEQLKSKQIAQNLVDIFGPIKFSATVHTVPVRLARFEGSAERILSVGDGDTTACVHNVLSYRAVGQANVTLDEAINLEKLKHKLKTYAIEAVQNVQLGRGAEMFESLKNLLDMMDAAEKGTDPQFKEPIKRAVNSLRRPALKALLHEQGIKTDGMIEKQEFVELLYSIKLDRRKDALWRSLENMEAADLKADLGVLGMSSRALLEKPEFVTAIYEARKDLKRMSIVDMKEELEYYCIPAQGIDDRTTLEKIIQAARQERTKAMAKQNDSGKNQTSQVEMKPKVAIHSSAGPMFDQLLSHSLSFSADFGISNELIGLEVMLRLNRDILIEACRRRVPVSIVLSGERGKAKKKVHDPFDLDWSLRQETENLEELLCKGGDLYQRAHSLIGGSLITGMLFSFPELPGRIFEYTRYDEDKFVDRLSLKSPVVAASFEEVTISVRPEFVSSQGLHIPTDALLELLLHDLSDALKANQDRLRISVLKWQNFQVLRPSALTVRMKIMASHSGKDSRSSRQLADILCDMVGDAEELKSFKYARHISSCRASQRVHRAQDEKNVRWGDHHWGNHRGCRIGNGGVVTSSEPTQSAVEVKKKLMLLMCFSTALLYQAPMPVPCLMDTSDRSKLSVEETFRKLDCINKGRLDVSDLSENLKRNPSICKELGMLTDDDEDMDSISTSIVSPPDVQKTASVCLQDWFDFFIPTINRHSQLTFKIEILQLTDGKQSLKFGLIEARPTKLPAGLQINSDWCLSHFPAYFIDSGGQLWRHGQVIETTGAVLRTGDIVSGTLDQYTCTLRFWKEGCSTSLGFITNVHGMIKWGVQLCHDQDSVKLLPF